MPSSSGGGVGGGKQLTTDNGGEDEEVQQTESGGERQRPSLLSAKSQRAGEFPRPFDVMEVLLQRLKEKKTF